MSKDVVVSTLAGTGEYKFFDSKATSTAFKSVYGVALDQARGALYIADRDDNRLRVINLADGSTSTLAGTGEAGHADTTSNAVKEAKFNCPNGLAFDSSNGVLYVADQKNYCIRSVNTKSGHVATIAGHPSKPGSTDGKGSGASFSFPSGLALDEKNQLLYVSDQTSAIIRVIKLADAVVSTLAGDKNETEKRHADGKGVSAVFGAPVGLGLDTVRNVLYVCDRWGNRVRAINIAPGPDYGTVTTIAGAAEAGCVDGTGATARFDSPNGLAIDTQRNLLFVADNQSHRIRVISQNAGVWTVSTLAGSGKKGFADGKATAAAFNFPKGLAFDSAKQLIYVTDQDNHRVRVIDLSPVLTFTSPAANAAASNDSKSSSGGGAVSAAGAASSGSGGAKGGGDLVSGLMNLANLKRDGFLTEEEFVQAKKMLLSIGN